MARECRSGILENQANQQRRAPRQAFSGVQDQGCLLARPCLWGLLLFLLVSCCAYYFRDFNLFAAASEPVRELLGYPPPALLVSIALAVYGFSALVLTLTAIAYGSRPVGKWNHLGYRSAFYLFFAFSGSISANFLPVLLVGVALYCLDLSHIWLYGARDKIAEQPDVRF